MVSLMHGCSDIVLLPSGSQELLPLTAKVPHIKAYSLTSPLTVTVTVRYHTLKLQQWRHQTTSSCPADLRVASMQKLRSFTENYRQSYSIRTVRDWNALSQSVVSAGSSAQFKGQLTHHISPEACSSSV